MLVLPATNSESGDAKFTQIQNGEYMERPLPSLFEGSGIAGVHALAAAGSMLALGGAKIAEEMSQPANQVFGDSHQQEIKDFQSNMVDFQKYLQPNPQTTGFVGNILYGVGSIAPVATIGALTGGVAGMALLPGITQGYSDFRLHEKEGVDPETSMKLGVLSGATTAVGAVGGGVFGKTIGTKIATGAATNVAFGGANRYAASTILDNAGYKDMAEQYKVMDGSAVVADAILGAGFGAMHRHVELEKAITPHDTETALAMNGVKQFEDAAPGIPTTPAARGEHFEAMKVASEQLMKGEPVDVASVFKGEDFLQRPSNPEIEIAAQSVSKDTGLTQALDELQQYRDKARELGIQIDEEPIGQNSAIPIPSETILQQRVTNLETAISEITNKQPEDLISFLSKNGGVKDQGGDLLYSMGNKGANPFTPGAGRLIREKGRTLDDALRFAKETGFMPEDSNIEDFKGKLGEALNGKKLYRPEEAHLAERVADLEEEAYHAGVDTVGKLPEDIRAEIEERKAIAYENGVGDILDENPHMEIPTEDGDKNAYQAMTDAELEEKQAEIDSKLYEVAVNCAIRNLL